MNALFEATTRIEQFRDGSLGSTVARIESKFIGSNKGAAQTVLTENQIGMDLLLAAILVKKSSAQINEILHAVGILLALPTILREDEVIESFSLAAGNTGKGFDLETNQRVAEFTFIQWQGGSEAIRQNKILKDFTFWQKQIPPKKESFTRLALYIPRNSSAANDPYQRFSKEMQSLEVLGNMEFSSPKYAITVSLDLS